MTNPIGLSNHAAEEMLIQNASNEDLNTFNQLVLTYQDIAYNHTYALLGDPDLAKEAAQALRVPIGTVKSRLVRGRR